MTSFKILRLAAIHYPHAKDQLTSKLNERQGLSYSEMIDVVHDESVMHSNWFAKGMTALGHDACEILCDLDVLQMVWAKERGIPIDNDWRLNVLLDQIKVHQPDILYMQDIYNLPFSIRKELKERFPSIKKVVLFKGYPGAYDELEGMDVILSCAPRLVDLFKETGHSNVHLMYHGFDSSIQIPDPVEEPVDFLFAGSTGCGGLGADHKRRYSLLSGLMKHTPLEIWGDEAGRYMPWDLEKRPTTKVSRHFGKWVLGMLPAKTLEALLSKGILPKFVADQCKQLIQEKRAVALFPMLGWRGLEAMVKNGSIPDSLIYLAEVYLSEWRDLAVPGLQEWESEDLVRMDTQVPLFPLRDFYPERFHNPVFGVEMYQLLRRAKLSFNIHIDTIQGQAGNMRMFEVTGAGSCLLTDAASNMSDLFEDGKEVVTYSSLEECVEKANYLLENEAERAEIATAGHKRTLKSHTLGHRCVEIEQHIQNSLNSSVSALAN